MLLVLNIEYRIFEYNRYLCSTHLVPGKWELTTHYILSYIDEYVCRSPKHVVCSQLTCYVVAHADNHVIRNNCKVKHTRGTFMPFC